MLKRHMLYPLCAMTAVAFAAPSSRAADPAPQRPAALTVQALPLEQVTLVEAPLSPRAEIDAQDAVDEAQGLPLRFAESYPVLITPDTDGRWEKLADGRMMWRLRIGSPDAVSLNLGFTRYHMPDGGHLFFYAADGSEVVRPFSADDNHDHGELWTPVIHHDEVIVEVTLPDESYIPQLELELGAINPGYRGFLAGPADGGERSGSCNVDVICPEGDLWRDQIKSSGVYTRNGSWTCSGAMVNNTAFDKTPYFLTANHCGISSTNAASVVVYWNYENSTCRPPGSGASGGAGDGSLSQFTSGSTLRANYSPSDFALIELSSEPPQAFEVFYSGWDRSSADFASIVAIHHPNTDEKRISFEYDPTTTTSYLGNAVPGDGTHIRITDWDLGTTEPGSSGSPIYDPAQRIVGQLHGGYASCTSQTSDWYGRVSVSWTGGGTASTRLSNWLDPLGTAPMAIDGTGLDEPPVTSNVSMQMIVDTVAQITLDGSDANMDPLDFIINTLPSSGALSDPQAGAINSVPYTLANKGQVVHYSPDSGYMGPDVFSFKVNDGKLPPDGGDSNLSYAFVTVVNTPPLIVTTSLPDGQVDEPYGPVQLDASGGEGSLVWQIVADVPYLEEDLGTSGFAESGDAQGWHADDGFWTYALPFPFPFYDGLYTSVRVWSNGFLNFGPHSGSSYANSDALLRSNRRIAPLWDDLRTNQPGEDIFIDTTGVGQVTFRFKASTYSGAHPVNVAITLHDTGVIDFHYGPGNAPITATAGISDGDDVRYTLSRHNNAADLGWANSVRFAKPDQLSPGLAMSATGQLSGTPENAGAYLPVIRVTDSLGRSDETAVPLLVVSIPGDFDGDGDVDGDDLLVFTQCLAGPMASPPLAASPPSTADCLDAFDFNVDGRVDLPDFGGLQDAATP
jgi:hypothetical protein